jgi:hypothetical protein
LIGALVQDQKALDYLKSAPRSWARVAEDAFAGLAYLFEGSTPKSGRYSPELQECVKSMMPDLRGDFTENWMRPRHLAAGRNVGELDCGSRLPTPEETGRAPSSGLIAVPSRCTVCT